MSQKIMIITNSAAGLPFGATANERDLITGYLEGKGWHVWHWFEDLWLVKTVSDTLVNVSALHDELLNLLARKRHILVFEMTDATGLRGSVTKGGAPWIAAHWVNSK